MGQTWPSAQGLLYEGQLSRYCISLIQMLHNMSGNKICSIIFRVICSAMCSVLCSVICSVSRDVNKDLTPKDQDKDLTRTRT